MSKRLKDLYASEMLRARGAIEKFPWDQSEVYGEWMAQTYYYSSYSTRIIGLAGSLFPYKMNDFHLRFLEHAKEEKNHEKVMLVDLKDLKKDLKDYPELVQTQALYQTQYYWIQNIHPISVYGYFLYLEGLAVEHGRYILDRVQSAYGDKGSKFLKLHVNEDVAHVSEHFKHLEAVTTEQFSMIEKNLIACSGLYENMLDGIVRQTFEKKKKAA